MANRKSVTLASARMEAQLRGIQAGVNKARNDLNSLVDTLKNVSDRWRSIQTAFNDHPDQLDSFSKFPDLRSKLELEQLSICDTIIAGISQSLLMLEHAVTSARAALLKAKRTFKSKDLTEAWSFPPSTGFVGDLFIETDNLIEDASESLELHRLGLYNLNTLHENINPDSISQFINSVS